jgi:hypothetical protein
MTDTKTPSPSTHMVEMKRLRFRETLQAHLGNANAAIVFELKPSVGSKALPDEQGGSHENHTVGGKNVGLLEIVISHDASLVVVNPVVELSHAGLQAQSRLRIVETAYKGEGCTNLDLIPQVGVAGLLPQTHLQVATPELAGIELAGVAEQLEEGAGAWRACSGCHELIEGHPTGPWSETLKSYMGGGCRECGGIGAIWDSIDYKQVHDPAPIAKAAGSRPMDEASLPTTSRLSQLEARTSCAASVNDQLTSPSQQPQSHALGCCDHRPHPPAPQDSDQQPDRHDHRKPTTTNWACDLAFGTQSEFRHQVAGNETDSKSDPEREKQHLVKVAQDGNEVRDEIDRRESVGSHAACDQLGSERGPLVLSGDPECDCIPLQGFCPAFQSLEPALHTSTYTVTAEETVKPTRAASPAPQTREVGRPVTRRDTILASVRVDDRR